MKHSISSIPRIVCLVGAFFDGLVTIPMLSPTIAARLFLISDFEPGPDYRYAMYIAASLMVGWTCLLIWTAFQPIERRWVLLLTGIPAIVGLIAAGIYAVSTKLIPLNAMIPTIAIQMVLLILFVMSYCIARKANKDNQSQ